MRHRRIFVDCQSYLLSISLLEKVDDIVRKALFAGKDRDEEILENVRKARALHVELEDAFLQDGEVKTLLAEYRNAILKTSTKMERIGVAAHCAACAVEEMGSCCFQGIEADYDPMLLLINLLLGCDVPESREYNDSCFFVGDKGCRLIGKYYFCIHYLCPKLKRHLGPSGCAELLPLVGEELFAGWRLEQALRQLHQKMGGGS